MPPKTKIELIQDAWKGLDMPWVEDEEYMARKGQLSFRRSCDFFHIYVFGIEPGRWGFEMVTADGVVQYSQTLKLEATANQTESLLAREAAMRELFDILNGGLGYLFGISISTADRPIDEIRVKTAFIQTYIDPMNNRPTNLMHGVGEDGIVYTFDPVKENWEKVSMRKAR